MPVVICTLEKQIQDLLQIVSTVGTKIAYSTSYSCRTCGQFSSIIHCTNCNRYSWSSSSFTDLACPQLSRQTSCRDCRWRWISRQTNLMFPWSHISTWLLWTWTSWTTWLIDYLNKQFSLNYFKQFIKVTKHTIPKNWYLPISFWEIFYLFSNYSINRHNVGRI